MTTPERRERALQWHQVPAGTPAAECQAKRLGGTCTALVYWIQKPSAKDPKKMARIPVDCDYNAQCTPPRHDEEGMGVSHFQTCPDVALFSRGGR